VISNHGLKLGTDTTESGSLFQLAHVIYVLFPPNISADGDA